MRKYALMVALAAALSIVGLNKETAWAETANKPQPPPVAQTIIVTVQPGDCLSTIADSYGISYVRIYDANMQIVNPDLIFPGESLVIPNASAVLATRILPATEPSSPPPEVATLPTADQTIQQPVAAPEPSPSTVSNQTPQLAGQSIWYSLAQCESSGNWAADTGNGFYGGLQFTLSSWNYVGGVGYPNQASPSEQIMRAQMLQARQGWSAWPVCSVQLGL